MIIKIISNEPLSEEILAQLKCCAYSDGTYPKPQTEITLSISQARYIHRGLKMILEKLCLVQKN